MSVLNQQEKLILFQRNKKMMILLIILTRKFEKLILNSIKEELNLQNCFYKKLTMVTNTQLINLENISQKFLVKIRRESNLSSNNKNSSKNTESINEEQ